MNSFQFTKMDTFYLCRKLESVGIRYIEIGHGLGLGAYRMGGSYSAAASDKDYMEAARDGLTRAKFGMFCIPGIANLDDIDIASDHGMHFLRVGIDVSEVEKTSTFIERAKKNGMLVATNYMKSYVVSPREFAGKARISKEYGTDIVYLVDSAGGMLPKEVESYIDVLNDLVEIDFGYHGHDNLGLAVANSLVCYEKGARFIDASLQGLGRSAGNASTEQVVLALARYGKETGIDILDLVDLGFEEIQPILKGIGKNPIDLVAGYALFHSSYMPTIRKYANKYSVDPKLLIIELCKINRVEAPDALVEKLAIDLKSESKDKKLLVSKYHMEEYLVDEQS